MALSDVNAKRVRLFVKPYCPWCHQAVDWLKRRGVVHETHDVSADPTAYADMMRLSGQTLAPVIEVDGQVLANFGARELAQWWQDRESL